MFSQFKINQINEELHENWFFIGRCSFKSQKLTYSNNFKSGTYFSFHLKDEFSDIKVVLFDQMADQIFCLIEFNRLFKISNGRVVKANPNFQRTTKSDFEIRFYSGSSIKKFWDSNFEFPPFIFRFKSVPEFWQVATHTFDFIGIILNIGKPTIKKKIPMREIILLDRTFSEISLVLWGAQAFCFNELPKSILVINYVKIKEFLDSKNLELTQLSSIQINPKISESFMLKSFLDSNITIIQKRIDYLNSFNENFNWNTLSVLTMENYLIIHKANLKIKATIIEIKPPISFFQCYTCKRPVTALGATFSCKFCKKKIAYPKKTSFLLFLIADHTKSYWVTISEEVLIDFFETKSLILIINKFLSKSFVFHLECKRLKSQSSKPFDAKVVKITRPGPDYCAFLIQKLSCN